MGLPEAPDLWEVALSRLKESDAECDVEVTQLLTQLDLSFNVETLIDDIKSSKAAREQDGWVVKLPRGSPGGQRVVNVRSMVYRILEAAFEFKEVVDKVMKFDPTEYGALAWAAVSLAITMVMNGKLHHEAARTAATYLAEEQCKYARICAQYLRKSTTGRSELTDRIVEAYISQLRLSAGILAMNKEGIVSKALRHLDKKSPLEPLVAETESADRGVQECLGRVAQESLEADFVVVKHKLDNYRSAAIRSSKTLVAIESFIEAETRHKILNWVFPGEESAHAVVRSKVPEGVQDTAGRWILETDQFKSWEAANGPVGLHIVGLVGTGKTILTSTVFEYIRSKYGRTGDTGVPVAVFYCSGVRKSFETIDPGAGSGARDVLRCILRQWGQATEGFKVLEAEYTRRDDKAPPDLRDTKGLIRDIASMSPQSFIVLDGMDECLAIGEDQERLNLLELFNELLTLSSGTKILVSSRFEQDIEERTEDWDRVLMADSATESDLNRFVDKTIDRKLRTKRGCSDELRSELKLTLKKKAAGNFRWAQLSLDYICGPSLKSFELVPALKSLPAKLEEFYCRLLSELRNDPSEFNRLVGERSIKLILGNLHYNAALGRWPQTTKDFLRVILKGTPYDHKHSGKINPGDIRGACHHLVAWDTSKDIFDFGHFSVVEFFSQSSKAISDFDDIRVWQVVSEICLMDMRESLSKLPREDTGATGARGGLYTVPGLVEGLYLFWSLFTHSFRRSLRLSTMEMTKKIRLVSIYVVKGSTEPLEHRWGGLAIRSWEFYIPQWISHYVPPDDRPDLYAPTTIFTYLSKRPEILEDFPGEGRYPGVEEPRRVGLIYEGIDPLTSEELEGLKKLIEGDAIIIGNSLNGCFESRVENEGLSPARYHFGSAGNPVLWDCLRVGTSCEDTWPQRFLCLLGTRVLAGLVAKVLFHCPTASSRASVKEELAKMAELSQQAEKESRGSARGPEWEAPWTMFKCPPGCNCHEVPLPRATLV